jgi:rare lipoprotein A
MSKQIVAVVLASLVLSACGSTPQRKVETRSAPAPIENRSVGAAATTAAVVDTQVGGGYLSGDGPGANAPVDIETIPDAVPRNEPLHRYANRPYVALGKTYTPQKTAGNFRERGIASWYGKKFHGQRTSSGEVYDMYGMTAAHPTLPIPSYVRVTNVANDKSVVVRVNDRGPFLHERVIDLSYTAAHKLGIVGAGSAEVTIESLSASEHLATAPVKKTAPVESRPLVSSEPVAETEAQPAKITTTTRGSNIYLQLGAFKSTQAAESFMAKMRSELGSVDKELSLFVKDGLTRVHIGPYKTQDAARSSAVEMQDKLGFKPMVNLH